MIAFFIILGILFFLSLIFLILCLSNLEIEVEKFDFNSTNIKGKKIEDYLIYIKIKLLDKITLFKLKINHEKINKWEKSKLLKLKIFDKINNIFKIEDTILKNKKEIFKKENLKYIKELKIKIKKLNLNLQICVGETILTVYAIVIISTIISILLAKNIEAYSKDKYNYRIMPIYNSKPSIVINLNCIINVKLVHIINVIYMLVKKRGGIYDERTSDRRAYVCSHD